MYRVEVIADNSGTWCGNGLTFETEAAAHEYGRDLSWRWTAVREYRVVPVVPAVTPSVPAVEVIQ